MPDDNITPQRFSKIRSTVKAVKENASNNANLLKQTPTTEKGENPWINLTRAETRKMVSETMYDHDRNLPQTQIDEIKQRQMDKYFSSEISKPHIRGHVEAHHGARIKDPHMRLFCIKNAYTSYEVYTGRIAQKVCNNAVFKKARLHTDINNLPEEARTSIQSERACLTKEYNLNGIKAQRDLTEKILRDTDNLTLEGKAAKPYITIMLHGKTDKRGHDFEIAAKQVKDQTPLDPRLAFWIAEKIREKSIRKGIKNPQGQPPTVNVVAYGGAYSGSPALRRLRYGDNVFDFAGFGEMLQVLQLECGTFIRQEYRDEIAEIINELLEDFTHEFKTADDFNKLTKFSKNLTDKIEAEKLRLFHKDNVMFSPDHPENEIGLSKTLREELTVTNGDLVMFLGKTLTVKGMLTADLKTGKTMKIHSALEADTAQTLQIQKS